MINLLYALFLSTLTLVFLGLNTDSAVVIINQPLLFLVIFTFVFVFFSILITRLRKTALTPILILLLLLPYNFFFGYSIGPWSGIYFCILLGGIAIFHSILKNRSWFIPTPWRLGALALYAVYFGSTAIGQYLNYQNHEAFDLAISSQLQWNTIHGRFFETSISGSNFVTHNSPFLIFLSPFYALVPDPRTLLALKSLLLSLSAIPFYLIARHLLSNTSAIPLTIGFLFFPHLVSQHFIAPHEACFLPFFLLYSFYFHLKNRFKPFLAFLILALLIKEHLAFVAIMYGVYALLLKRSKRWILTPIILGMIWAVFSGWLIHYFQQIYTVDPNPAWLIADIKRRFLDPDAYLTGGLKTSTLGNARHLSFLYLFFSPLLLILPFFSAIVLLGLPELIINALSRHPLMLPTWHYSITVACFFLIACVESIKRLTVSFRQQNLLSWLLCLCILCHAHLWSYFSTIKPDASYAHAANLALAHIPPDASVSTSAKFAAHLANRREYFLPRDPRKGDYVVLDQNQDIQEILSDQDSLNYNDVFTADGIRVLRRGK